MTRKNFLTGVVTTILLSLIVVLLSWNSEDGAAKAVAQNQNAGDKHTASVKHFTLPEMVGNADKIFRGTLVDFQPGTINAGGGVLQTVTYRFRVNEAFQGNFDSKGDVQYTEITTLSNLKEVPQQGNYKKFSVLPTLPLLKVGTEYLMLMTPASSVGLTTAVGLGQGSFEVYSRDNETWARNEFNNAGLFKGPIAYKDLANKIRREISAKNKKGVK